VACEVSAPPFRSGGGRVKPIARTRLGPPREPRFCATASTCGHPAQWKTSQSILCVISHAVGARRKTTRVPHAVCASRRAARARRVVANAPRAGRGTASAARAHRKSAGSARVRHGIEQAHHGDHGMAGVGRTRRGSACSTGVCRGVKHAAHARCRRHVEFALIARRARGGRGTCGGCWARCGCCVKLCWSCELRRQCALECILDTESYSLIHEGAGTHPTHLSP
jgi:hypothetical protein